MKGSGTEMIEAPTIHLNGSSEQRLLDALVAATVALRAAEDAVAETAPHGRDYYVQQDGRFEEAQRQHRARMVALELVRTELELQARAVFDQMEARRAR